jgi:hypothetical protein
LYRGQEFKALLTAFLKHQKKYKDLTAEQKDTYSWLNYKEGGKIRNTAIGTLLIDLSEGRELDVAVSAFERVVAPHNYKRPTALVTKSMITQAEKTIQQLGLENSLKRRHAIAEDISVSNLLFANRDVKGQELSLFDSLKDDVVINPRTFSKVDEVPVETFINDLLPTATEVEVLFENRHSSNLVSLIAPADKTAPSLLEWDNGISWDYNGGLADSVKEKVKKAGGAIEGEVRVSLEWFNYDDLDLHVKEPNGTVIYYGRKSGTKGGILDVDKNAGSGTTREPVENIIFKNMGNLLEGVYEVRVHQFNLRERDNIGFNVEIECRGDVYNLSRSTMVGYNETVSVAKFKYSRKDGITDFVSELEQTSKTISKELWGVNTNKFHKVSMVMLSPNYWGNKPKGNKHVFFIIDKVKNPETARGIFNEMIRPDLQEHRKVFEILGSKMKVDDSEKQLSGIGFSSTVKNDVLVKLSGKFSRTIRVKF